MRSPVKAGTLWLWFLIVPGGEIHSLFGLLFSFSSRLLLKNFIVYAKSGYFVRHWNNCCSIEAMKRQRIIGIAGLPRSGKDTLAEVFIEAGYYGVSLGDIVRNEAKKRHADKADPISVAHMTETANWLREKNGPDFALKQAQKMYEQASQSKQYKGLLVFSVRAPAEADYIIQHGGFLLWVEANDEARHQRLLQHLREGEIEISLEEFRAQENLQWKPQPGIPKEVQMNVSYVRSHATHVIENHGNDLEVFKKSAHSFADHINEALPSVE
jgi:dephospho-CoA kinase